MVLEAAAKCLKGPSLVRNADIFPTIGWIWSIFGRIGRQISDGIRDGVGPPESDYDPLRMWRVTKSDIAAGVR